MAKQNKIEGWCSTAHNSFKYHQQIIMSSVNLKITSNIYLQVPLIIGTNKNEGLLIKVKHFRHLFSKLTASKQIFKFKENIFLDISDKRETS